MGMQLTVGFAAPHWSGFRLTMARPRCTVSPCLLGLRSRKTPPWLASFDGRCQIPSCECAAARCALLRRAAAIQQRVAIADFILCGDLDKSHSRTMRSNSRNHPSSPGAPCSLGAPDRAKPKEPHPNPNPNLASSTSPCSSGQHAHVLEEQHAQLRHVLDSVADTLTADPWLGFGKGSGSG